MELEALLQRIKLDDVPRQPSSQYLNNLCMAFVSNIPFETLDLFGGKRKIWDIPTIYENIVVKKRGGFCCDINGLMHWTLKELGYKVELFQAWAFEKELKQFTSGVSNHMVLLVTLDNGQRWLTDVGWGGLCFSLPLRMEIGVEQSQPCGIYRLGEFEDMITVETKKQITLQSQEETDKTRSDQEILDDWIILFGFKMVSCKLEDFQDGYNWVLDECEFFKANPIVLLHNRVGRRMLFGNMFTEKKYIDPNTVKILRVEKCNIDEIYQILKDEFGIVLDFKLDVKCE